jgi:protocatechuate 3,4-dioxygenase beta subunit
MIAAPIALGAGLELGWVGEAAAADAWLAATGSKGRLAPTPDCGDDDEPTPPETAGPFFTPNSPQRGSLLEPGMKGTRLTVTGRVFSRGCRPVAGALLDFWHADDDGEYDNRGFRLRGHQFADHEGRWSLETIMPGVYTGRTRHIHVRVQPPGGRVLTTQLYFPGEPRNRTDELFSPRLLMAVKDDARAKRAQFHFVLDLG